jgi:clan AA aspartic protease (TIGR02281 family)
MAKCRLRPSPLWPLRYGAAALLLALASPAVAACKLTPLLDLPVTFIQRKPLVDAKINGDAVRLIVDTGATIGGLTPQAARHFSIKTQPLVTDGVVHSVAGEVVEFQVGTLKELKLGGVAIRDLEVLVGGRVPNVGAVGRLGENLFGLGDMEFDLAAREVRLFRPDRCSGAELAYWAPHSISVIPLEDGPPTRQLRGVVSINGHPVRAMFDTGAPETYLTRAAADRLGLAVKSDSHEPGVRGVTGDGRLIAVSTATIGQLDIGQEEARNVEVRVADLQTGSNELLVGLNFFLAHRMIVDRANNQLVFSPTGGGIFADLNEDQAAPAQP